MPPDQTTLSTGWVLPWNEESAGNRGVRRSVELASMAFHEQEYTRRLCRDDERTASKPIGQRRMAIAALSTIGMVSMGLAALYQLRMIRHLPSPPLPQSDSDRAKASCALAATARPIASQAVNVILAGIAGSRRGGSGLWLSLLLTGKSVVEAGQAVRDVFGRRAFAAEQPWCGYRLLDAVTRVGTLVLSLPEAAGAVRIGWQSLSTRRRS